MSGALGDLVIAMSVDIAKMQSDMGRAVRVVQQGADQMSEAIDGVKKGFEFAGLVLSLDAIKSKFDEVVEHADQMGKLGERLGATPEWLSGMEYQARLASVSTDELNLALGKLASNAAAAAGGNKQALATFQAIGVSVKDGNSQLKSTAQLYQEVAGKFATYADSAQKTADARDVFGKSGERIIPLLNQEGEAAKKAQAELDLLGGRITGQFAREADEFASNWTKVKVIGESWANSVAETVLPWLTKLTQAWIDAKKAHQGFLESLGQTVAVAIGGNDRDRNSAAIDKLTAQRDQLEQSIGHAQKFMSDNGPTFGGPDAKGLELMEGQLKAVNGDLSTQLNYRKLLDQQDKDAAASAKAAEDKRSKPAPNVPHVSGGDARAEQRSYESALQSLEQQLGKLDGATVTSQEHFRLYGKDIANADGTVVHLTGSLEKLKQTHKDTLEIEAAAVQKEKERQEVIDALTKHIKEAEAQQDALNKVTSDQVAAYAKDAQERQFQINLIGKTGLEQQRLTAAHQLDLDLQARIADASKEAGANTDAYNAKVAELTAQTNKQKDAVDALIVSQDTMNRSWSTGATQAMQDYIDHATNAAEQSKKLFTDAFQGMEDALVNFVKTGKLDFRSLADSIITDLIRMQIRASITKPLSDAINGGGGLGGLFGDSAGYGGLFGKSTSGVDVGAPMSLAAANALNGYASGTDYVPQTGLYQLHQGEAVIPAAANTGAAANAPHFYVDMRGASVEAVQQLHALVSQVNGSIEQRAVSATMEAARRNPSVARRLRGQG